MVQGDYLKMTQDVIDLDFSGQMSVECWFKN